MFDGIIEGIQNFVRGILFGPFSVVLNWLETMLEIILNEIAGYDFINLPFITNCYNIAVSAALILLPLKLIYEWVWLVIGNDSEKWGAKMLSILQIAIIMMATPPILDICSQTVKGLNEAVLSGEIINSQNKDTTISAGKGFAATVLTATTSLSQKQAEDFMEAYDKPGFDINNRNDDDQYIYDFDFIMPMLMCLVLFVLLLFIGIQMAVRIISIGFIKIIIPISALSLTNKENPNAWIVARNALASNFVMNTVQIFLLVFVFAIIGQLGEATPLAKVLFMIAMIFATIALPNLVTSMIGGYSSGIMESLQTMQNVLYSGATALHAGKAVAGGTGSLVKKLPQSIGNAGQTIRGGFNSLKDMPSKSIGKGMSMAGAVKDAVKDKIGSGKQFAGKMDQAIKEKGTSAVSTLAEKGLKQGTKDIASQVGQSAGKTVGNYAKGKANNFKDAVQRQKNMADAAHAFKPSKSSIKGNGNQIGTGSGNTRSSKLGSNQSGSASNFAQGNRETDRKGNSSFSNSEGHNNAIFDGNSGTYGEKNSSDTGTGKNLNPMNRPAMNQRMSTSNEKAKTKTTNDRAFRRSFNPSRMGMRPPNARFQNNKKRGGFK